MIINGETFIISSASGASTCVGVSITANGVKVVNTNEKRTIVDFTHAEWDAFLIGVKKGEFDLLQGEADYILRAD